MSGALRVYVLGNGSSGNCLVVEAEGERLLVDAGLGATTAVERMRALGEELVTSRPPLAVLVTHDHSDHAAHAFPVCRALRAPLLAHRGVTVPAGRSRVEVRPYDPTKPIRLGPLTIEALPVPHDAPQVALRISSDARSVGLATDLGHAPRALGAFLSRCDLVLLEANYCPYMLATGPYPPRLRDRVGGPLGHLANSQAADLALSLESTRVGRLVLLHLSRSNNAPERALDVVASRLRRLPVEVMSHGEARRFDVGASAFAMQRAEQLALAF